MRGVNVEPPGVDEYDDDGGNGQLWKVHDHLANKRGFRHDVYWVTGDRYRGYWDKNKKNGKGIHVYGDGNRYEGEWKDGKREGNGTFWVAEQGRYKALYRGAWKAGKWHGKGTLYGERGETYEGEFEKGKRSGFGKQTYWCEQLNTFEVYIGEWLDDKREGSGILHLANGDRYEGSFSNDMKEGKGVLFYRDGCSKYEGLWHCDTPICGTYKKLQNDGLPLLEVEKSDTLANTIINESISRIQNANVLQNDGLPLLEVEKSDTLADTVINESISRIQNANVLSDMLTI